MSPCNKWRLNFSLKMLFLSNIKCNERLQASVCSKMYLYDKQHPMFYRLKSNHKSHSLHEYIYIYIYIYIHA